MKQYKLMQMALEQDMTPEQIGEYRETLTLKYAVLTSKMDECETDIEKSAFITALLMFIEEVK